ncbi:hypothetical protein B0T24DRAFT_647605 [Lasiosphaeria ovina]|uniref:Peptidyl-prolyl cis-trans isomerase-like 2 n=1 Tax=Lasiosphaeria ovina TaxID=92902 RepID=A0AAE0NF22_9PEZI|nr:hypothetical protein B0T24DRAFT_647605 [Lasiosphaeria ovina]
MGKGTDKLYITHSEWSSSDAYGASVGSNARARRGEGVANFKRLPFNFCAASLQPFHNPVCTPDGTIFDVEVIGAWLDKHKTNPVTGEPLSSKDLIRLNFARNGDTAPDDTSTDSKGDLIDPVTFKVFTDNTHVVAVRHGAYANVFAWETVDRMNIKAKSWRDLVDDAEFGRKDIITLQNPQNAASRDLSQFKFLRDGSDTILTPAQREERDGAGSVNIDALGRIGEKVLRAKEAVERARREREAGGDVNRTTKPLLQQQKPGDSNVSSIRRTQQQQIQERKLAANAAAYTTGRAAASFTSTGLTPETSGERAVLTDEEWMLKPKRVKFKGYARVETNLGDLNVELHTETAPKAVWNFVRLAQKGYYRGMAFHRNIKNFMIQGGDPAGTGKGGASVWGRPFADELEGPHTHNARGVISMANKGKNTNSSQFFITYRPAPHLDHKHTIFGRVVDGLDVLDKMEATPTDPDSARPLADIVIRDVVVFVDPFAEFQRDKAERERAEAQRADVERRGGTDDDRTTWTGKRLRNDDGSALGTGASAPGAADASAVGKYLTKKKSPLQQSRTPTELADEAADAWEEQPSRKKAKTAGFGNFDGW